MGAPIGESAYSSRAIMGALFQRLIKQAGRPSRAASNTVMGFPILQVACSQEETTTMTNASKKTRDTNPSCRGRQERNRRPNITKSPMQWPNGVQSDRFRERFGLNGVCGRQPERSLSAAYHACKASVRLRRPTLPFAQKSPKKFRDRPLFHDGWIGITIANSDPAPALLLTVILPPISVRSCLQIARPRPLPP